MKRTAAVFSIILAAMLSLVASPLPYGLELDYDIDYLIDNDFTLVYDDYGTIVIDPPFWHVDERDEIVQEFSMADVSEYGDWFLAMALFIDSAPYDEIYDYIADELEEDGYDAETTLGFVNLFYSDPTEEELTELLLDGDLAEYLCDAIPARIIIEMIEESGVTLQYLNMWLYDDLTIYTLMAEGMGMAIYVNNDEVYDILETELGMAFLEEML